MHSSSTIWQQQIKTALKDASECNTYFSTNAFFQREFSNKIPHTYATLIDSNDPNDPLLQQVIIQPLDDSSITPPFSSTPIQEDEHSPLPGLIHKYPNRVLCITTKDCAIHCSYCFRQNFPYLGNTIYHNIAKVMAYLREHSEVNEVLLSGGDPFNLSNAKLQELVHDIEAIPHIKRLRIHSRTLSVVERLDSELLNILNTSSLDIVLVTHINHPKEITSYLADALTYFNGTVLNQSVLLKGVNDSAEVLSTLSERLFEIGILPYYLNMLDTVSGSERFYVEYESAKELHLGMQKRLSGYLVPKLVKDENKAYKTLL